MPDDTNVYNLIFPGSNNPNSQIEIADPLNFLFDNAAKENKIGTRQKPNSHIADKTISVLCDLYPINWPGRYMIQKPGKFQLGYFRPIYSWLKEGDDVVDANGNPRIGADGKVLKYRAFYSSRPTFGPEYYYLPNPPPPPPSFAIMIKPPPFGLRQKLPVFMELEDKFRTSSLPNLDDLPEEEGDEAPLSPRRQAMPPPVYEYDEGFYEPESHGMITIASDAHRSLPPDAIVPLPRPKYKRRIYPSTIFRDYQPRRIPQGTPQWVKPLYSGPAVPHHEPKVQIFAPFKHLIPIPISTCKSLSSAELAILGALKLYIDLPCKLFVPPSLHITPNTNIQIVLDRPCPRLPILNLNKLKDPLSQNAPKPAPSTFQIHPVTKRPKQTPEFALNSTEHDAEVAFHHFMHTCSGEAGPSGLSEEDKAHTPVVAGFHWMQQSKLYHFSDSSVAFLHQPRRLPDLESLSREYFLHSAMFDLHAYRTEWKEVTDAWYMVPPPHLEAPASTSEAIPAAPISVASPVPEPPATTSEAPRYVTEDMLDSRLQSLQSSISQQVQDQFQQLMALMASRFPPPPPPS